MSNSNNSHNTRPRRPSRRPLLDNTVPSPCIGLCWLDEQTGLCEGCFRRGDEIRDWMVMNREQRLALLLVLQERQDAAGIKR